MSNFTRDEFINKYQHEEVLEILKPEVTDAFINDICEQVVTFIQSENPNFKTDTLSTWQSEQLKKSQMEQALFALINGRYDRSSVNDPSYKTIADNTYSIIKRAGFLYKGLY